jgi:serine protease
MAMEATMMPALQASRKRPSPLTEPHRAVRLFAPQEIQMKAPRQTPRIARLGLVIGVTLVSLGSVPRAQVPAVNATLNAKQRLLAGEPLPVNLPALHGLAAQRQRPVFAPGRVVMKLAEGTTDEVATTLARHAGGYGIRRPPSADFIVVSLPLDADVVATAAALAAQPGVVYAQPDPIAVLAYVPNDPLYQYQWNFHRLNMERVWDINRGADAALTVAVVDSGLAYIDEGNFKQAPDLAGATFLSPHDFIWDDDTPVDLEGHGTHVAGTIAERTGNGTGAVGMAFNVALMPLKAVSGDWDEALGAPNVGTASVVAEAVRYAADHGANVINMSLGFESEVAPVRDAIIYAVDKGAVVVAAAGNSGDQGSPEFWPAAYAGSIEGLIAVAAVDYDFDRAPYSNSNSYVEVAAPGGDLDVDADNDGYPDGILQETLDLDLVDQGIFNRFAYIFFEGTSMATPHVSGLAALLMKQGVKSPKAVEAIIESTATDVGAAGRDNDTGFGVINPRAAIFGMGLSR